MGASMSKRWAARRRSMAIDKQILKERRQNRGPLKLQVLLLGLPGSGKDRIVRQMKMLQQGGYTPSELAEFRLVVYTNLVDATKSIVLTMKEAGAYFVEGINRTYASQILEYGVDSDPSFRLSPSIVDAIESIWKDPTIATVIEQCDDPDLMESASYFRSHMQRISQKNYVPSETDVLKATVKGAGIAETRFNLGVMRICIYDISSYWQRSAVRKWVGCFEPVTSIIFCASLADYNQVVTGGTGQTRMDESLAMFDSVVNSPWLSRSSVILFLTKTEAFRSKLSKVPLERYLLEYTGGANVNQAAKYILWKYALVNRARLMIYPHLAQESDTSNHTLLFNALKETLLQNALRESGIL